MLGLSLELWTPGWGLPGTIGIISFVSFVIIKLAGENPDWLSLLFLFSGFLFIFLEIFIIPGIGVIAFLGAGLLLWSVYSEVFTFDSLFIFDFRHLLFIFSSLLIFAVSYLLFGFKRRGKNSSLFLHKVSLKETSSYVDDVSSFIGMIALTKTSLKPSGKILLKEKVYDAFIEDTFLEKNITVKIIGFRHGQFIVQERH